MKILIIAIVITGIASAAACLIIGGRVFDGTVTKKPYETGLLWDKAQSEKKMSGLDVIVRNSGFRVGENPLALDIQEKGKTLTQGPVMVTVSRPSTTAYDRTYACKKTGNGAWRAEVDLPLYGYWDFNIHVTRGANDIAFSRQVFAE